MVARVPWTMLKPSAFEEHADDVARVYAGEFRATAQGEAVWLASVIGMHGPPPDGAIRAVLARAMRMAATELEKGMPDAEMA